MVVMTAAGLTHHTEKVPTRERRRAQGKVRAGVALGKTRVWRRYWATLAPLTPSDMHGGSRGRGMGGWTEGVGLPLTRTPSLHYPTASTRVLHGLAAGKTSTRRERPPYNSPTWLPSRGFPPWGGTGRREHNTPRDPVHRRGCPCPFPLTSPACTCCPGSWRGLPCPRTGGCGAGWPPALGAAPPGCCQQCRGSLGPGPADHSRGGGGNNSKMMKEGNNSSKYDEGR